MQICTYNYTFLTQSGCSDSEQKPCCNKEKPKAAVNMILNQRLRNPVFDQICIVLPLKSTMCQLKIDQFPSSTQYPILH